MFESRQEDLNNNPNFGVTLLENLVSIFLGLNLSKAYRDEDFYACAFPVSIQKYAVLDMLLSQ